MDPMRADFSFFPHLVRSAFGFVVRTAFGRFLRGRQPPSSANPMRVPSPGAGDRPPLASGPPVSTPASPVPPEELLTTQPPAAAAWYYRRDGIEMGAVSLEKLRQFAAENTIG